MNHCQSDADWYSLCDDCWKVFLDRVGPDVDPRFPDEAPYTHTWSPDGILLSSAPNATSETINAVPVSEQIRPDPLSPNYSPNDVPELQSLRGESSKAALERSDARIVPMKSIKEVSKSEVSGHGPTQEDPLVLLLDSCYPHSSGEHERRDRLGKFLQSPNFSKNTLEHPDFLLKFFDMRDGMLNCTVYGCDEEFDRKDRARNHFRTHINHRPYPCLGCDNSNCVLRFYSKGNQTAHGTRHFSVCPRCQRRMEARNLDRHMKQTLRCINSGDSGM